MIFSWLASDAAISPTMRPSFMTYIRSDMPELLGITDLIYVMSDGRIVG